MSGYQSFPLDMDASVGYYVGSYLHSVELIRSDKERDEYG